MDPLTSRQQDILHYISDATASRGKPPTLQEIASAFGICVSNAFKHVRILRRKGHLDLRPRAHRGIRLVGGRRAWRVERRRLGEFEARIGEKLRAETDLLRLFEIVSADARAWLDVGRAELLVHEPARKILRNRAFFEGAGPGGGADEPNCETSPPELQRRRIPQSGVSAPADGIATRALRRRRTLAEGSLAAVPIPGRDRVLGVVRLEEGRPGRAIDDVALTRAGTLAAALAPALERASLDAELRRRIRLQAALVDLIRAVNATEDFRRIVRDVHAVVGSLVDAPYFEIAVTDEEGRWWILLETDTVDGRTVARDDPHVVDPVSNVALRAVKTQPFYILHRTPEEVRALESSGARRSDDGWTPTGHTAKRSRSILYVPLRTAGDRIGYLSAQSYRYRAYSVRDAEDLILAGEYIGLALRGAWRRERAVESLRRRVRELESKRGTIDS